MEPQITDSLVAAKLALGVASILPMTNSIVQQEMMPPARELTASSHSTHKPLFPLAQLQTGDTKDTKEQRHCGGMQAASQRGDRHSGQPQWGGCQQEEGKPGMQHKCQFVTLRALECQRQRGLIV